MRILAKPKHGTSNLINDRLYGEIEKDPDVEVIPWNPIRMLLCRYDILHVHWPENVLNDRIWLRSVCKVAALIVSIVWIKLFRRKLVWTAHNAVSHMGYHPRLESLFWSLFIPLLDGIIALSNESLKQIHLHRRVSDLAAMLVVPHGNYSGVYPNEITQQEARQKLELLSDRKVLLNLGLVRRYKKVERLIELGREDPTLQILIAGKVAEGDYGDELIQLAAGLDNVHLHFKFIPDDELQLYLKASDLFVLPYDKITNSGSAILALSYNLPVLAPNLPCFLSLQKTFGDSWVSTYFGAFSSEILKDYYGRPAPTEHPVTVDWGDWEWSSIASRVSNFYKTVIRK